MELRARVTFWSLLPILMAVLAVLPGCGPPPPAEDALAAMPINTSSPAGAEVVSTAPTGAKRGHLAPIDLVQSDGELLVHIDLRRLRSSVLYHGVKLMLEQDSWEIRRFADRCGLSPFDAIDEIAISMHDVDREQPLVVATLNITGEAAMECVRKWWKRGHAVTVAGRAAYAARSSRRSLVALVVDNMLLLGRPIAIKRALSRREAKGHCEPVHLHAALALTDDTPLAAIAETSFEEVELAQGHLTIDGKRLELFGEVRFRDTNHRKAAAYAQRAERDILSARRELRQLLVRVLGPNHSLVSQLDGLDLSRKDRTVTAKLTIEATESMRKELDAGMARYQRKSQVSEARNTVEAIVRGAVAAFEREIAGPNGRVVHAFCTSASDVPAKVPRGRKYQPADRPGTDYYRGDPAAGWRCLKFAMTQPHRYQYAYRQGGNYKGPARGGPDPGPKGFEASAEGDLDGDGKTSLFTRIGTIDPHTGLLRLAPQLFVVDELE